MAAVDPQSPRARPVPLAGTGGASVDFADLPASKVGTGARSVAGVRRGRVRPGVPLLRAAAVLVAVAVVLCGALVAATSSSGTPADGAGAVWLEHAWAGDYHSAAEYDALAGRLKREQIRDVFVHVGPLSPDGTIPEQRSPFAAMLVRELKQRDPRLRLLAWIGQLERASGLPDDQVVDLANGEVRDGIRATAVRFVAQEGFDGVHYDIEPLVDGSPGYLRLLDATRAALSPGGALSVTAPMWVPNATVARLARTGAGRQHALWSGAYYAEVARRVDQVVVMAYNTGLPSGRLYQLAVRLQTRQVRSALAAASPPPELLVGLPAYHDNGPWFHDAVENLPNGLAGVDAALSGPGPARPSVGVAIYRFALISDADWAAYERRWLGTSG